LLHEYFHLYGADDFSAAEIAAGDSDDFHVIAHKLALSNPARAITNAYNLQFYFTGE
jgi:hypothetical protein